MPDEGNLYGDLLQIAAGNVSIATDRLREFNAFANDVAHAGTPSTFHEGSVAIRGTGSHLVPEVASEAQGNSQREESLELGSRG